MKIHPKSYCVSLAAFHVFAGFVASTGVVFFPLPGDVTFEAQQVVQLAVELMPFGVRRAQNEWVESVFGWGLGGLISLKLQFSFLSLEVWLGLVRFVDTEEMLYRNSLVFEHWV